MTGVERCVTLPDMTDPTPPLTAALDAESPYRTTPPSATERADVSTSRASVMSPVDPERWRYLGSGYTRHYVEHYAEAYASRLSSRRALLLCGREGETYDIESWSRQTSRPDSTCKRCLSRIADSQGSPPPPVAGNEGPANA